MQQFLPIRNKLLRSPALLQAMAIASSVGVHYLLVSNLGLFARLDPPVIRPIRGGIKVVDLTPAEQTRVPTAVKSNPLPIDPTPVNPAPATRTPLTFNDPAPFTPPSTVLPTPSVAINNKTPDKNKPAPPPDRTTPPLSLDPEKPKTPTSPTKPPGSTTPTSPTRSPGSDTPTSPTRSPGSDTPTSPTRSPGSTTSTSPTRPPGSTTSTSPTRSPASTTPTNNFEQIKNNFDRDVQNLKQQIGTGDVIERPAQQLPVRAYPKVPRCSSQRNGYILVAILLDDDGNTAGSILPLTASAELGDKQGNTFIGNVLAEADKTAREQHEARSAQQKLAEKGKKVLYKFSFEFDAKSCPF